MSEVKENIVLINESLKPKEIRINDWELSKTTFNSPEAGSGSHDYLVHGFVQALHVSFSNHLNLVISPDDIYHIILEVINEIVNKNPEKYRKNLVNFEGKMKLKIQRNNFSKDISKNDWTTCFSEFREKIAENSKMDLNLEFSTSTELDKLISSTLIMGINKEYFGYEVYTMCGIPSIKILGTIEDWEKLKKYINETVFIFSKDYSDNLLIIIDKFIETFNNIYDIPFWNSIYKYESSSGTDKVTGWVTKLFNKNSTLTLRDLPSISSLITFKWIYYEEEINLLLTSGFGDFNIENSTIKTTRYWSIYKLDN